MTPYRTRRVDLGGVVLVLDEWPGERRRPVLFLHATGFTRGVWRPVASNLSDVCRPVALDLRGHGGSQSSLPAAGWTEMAEDVERLADLEGWSGLVIVGHSLGGGVGILLAQARPDLVDALVLVEAPLRAPTGEVKGSANEMVEVALRRRYEWPSREAAAEHLRARSPYDAWHPDVFAGFVDAGLRAAGGGADGSEGAVQLACARETEAAVFTGGKPGDLWDALPRLECPVWIGRGTGSRGLYSTTSAEAASRPRRAYEWKAERSGHFAPLERPQWVEAMVREALGVLDGAPPAAGRGQA